MTSHCFRKLPGLDTKIAKEENVATSECDDVQEDKCLKSVECMIRCVP